MSLLQCDKHLTEFEAFNSNPRQLHQTDHGQDILVYSCAFEVVVASSSCRLSQTDLQERIVSPSLQTEAERTQSRRPCPWGPSGCFLKWVARGDLHSDDIYIYIDWSRNYWLKAYGLLNHKTSLKEAHLVCTNPADFKTRHASHQHQLKQLQEPVVHNYLHQWPNISRTMFFFPLLHCQGVPTHVLHAHLYIIILMYIWNSSRI